MIDAERFEAAESQIMAGRYGPQTAPLISARDTVPGDKRSSLKTERGKAGAREKELSRRARRKRRKVQNSRVTRLAIGYVIGSREIARVSRSLPRDAGPPRRQHRRDLFTEKRAPREGRADETIDRGGSFRRGDAFRDYATTIARSPRRM